jgi:predicted Zn-dependent peptidase
MRPQLAYACCVCLLACTAPDQPPAPTPGTAAEAPQAQGTGPGAGQPPVGTPAAKELAPAGAAVPALMRLGNGLAWHWASSPLPGMALLQLGLPAGTDFGAAGLAELAAETLVAGGDASAGRPGLRQTVLDLGGILEVDLGPDRTWITLQVPASRWQQAHRALAIALQAPTLSRHQLERIREDFLLARIRAIWDDRVRQTPRAFLLGHSGTGDYVASLLDRDVSEVATFLARAYRPEGAVLGLRLPGSQQGVAAELAGGLASWRASPAPALAAPATPRGLRPGVHWSPVPGVAITNSTVVLPLPATHTEQALPHWLLTACLVGDGTGGRLARSLAKLPSGTRSVEARVVTTGSSKAVILTTTLPPQAVPRWWAVVEAARRSLVEQPPDAAELQAASRSAQLLLGLASDSLRSQLREESCRILAAPDAEKPPLPDFELALRQPGGLELGRHAGEWLQTPVAMLVLGGMPPAELQASTFDLLPAGAMARLLANQDPMGQAAAAQPFLDQAMEAVGGAAALRQLTAFRAAMRRQAAIGAAIEEQHQWQRGGLLRRTREVLGTKIHTEILGDSSKGTGSKESSGTTSVVLERFEQQRQRREIERHPLLLLAAAARGDILFRPVATRRVDDRECMVLEAMTGGFDRLRLLIDTISHLVRRVEVWETNAAGSVVYLEDQWSDYRQSGSLRTPFHCLTIQDDGEGRLETVYSSWQAVPPAALEAKPAR